MRIVCHVTRCYIFGVAFNSLAWGTCSSIDTTSHAADSSTSCVVVAHIVVVVVILRAKVNRSAYLIVVVTLHFILEYVFKI